MLETIKTLARAQLSSVTPSRWDIDAKKLYRLYAKEAFPSVEERDLEDTWIDTVKEMEDISPKMYAEYLEHRKDAKPKGTIEWSEVNFIEGITDGEQIVMTIGVQDKHVKIECSTKNVMDPSYVVMRLRFALALNIDCPYTKTSKKGLWWPDVVLKWLQTPTMRRVEQQMKSETVEQSIIEYLQDPLDVTTNSRAYLQQKYPVRDGGMVYIPFSGCVAFIQQRMGKETAERMVTTSLAKLGAKKRQMGVDRKWFYELSYETLTSTKTWRGEDNGFVGGGEVSFKEQWNRVSNDLRESERSRHEGEDGVGESEAVPDNDDSRRVLSILEGDKGSELDSIPF